jgi:hypothetical protein
MNSRQALRLFLQSSSGRKRYNVLGDYSNRDTSLITITNEDYVNSDTIVELLIKINNAHSDSGEESISSFEVAI